MKFVPIPTNEQALRKLSRVWLPFLPRIAARSGEPLDGMLDAIISGKIQIALVWDEEAKAARALVGMQYRRLAGELVAEIIWLTGFGSKDWQHLLPEMEQYLKAHVGANKIRPICRPGWWRLLKTKGYRQTHTVLEKSL
jgi:hypothetical protein